MTKKAIEQLEDEIEAGLEDLWSGVNDLEVELWALAMGCRDYLAEED